MDWSLVILAAVTCVAVPCFDLLTWLFISIKFYKTNPLAKEEGKVGTYISLKQFNNTNKLIGSLEISFDELFGLTTNSTLKYENEALLKKLAESRKRIKLLEEKHGVNE